MRFFEPNEKRTTIAVYVFLVCVFALLCVVVGANIDVIWSLLGAFMVIMRPFIYGFVIAFALHTPVRFVEENVLGSTKLKGRVKHALSVVIVYVTVVLIILLFCLTAIPQIISNFDVFKVKIDDFVVNFQNKTAELLSSSKNTAVNVYFDIEPALRKNPSDRLFSFTLRNYDGIAIGVKDNSMREKVKELFNKIVASIGNMLGNSLPDIFSSALTVLVETKNLVIGVIISLYFLLGERRHRQYLSHMGNVWLPKGVYKVCVWLIDKSKNIFRDYIVVRLLDGVIIGILTMVCLFVFQTPLAALLALIMGVGSLFPFIGPIVSTAICSLIMMIIDIRYMLVFLIVSILLHILDTRYIEPMLNSGRNNHKLSAIWVFAAIVVMGGFFGIIGILIGIPLVAFIYSIVKELVEKRLKLRSLATETAEWYIGSEEGEESSEAEIPEIEEGADMKAFFEERDETEAYRHMRSRIRWLSRKLRPAIKKVKEFFVAVWIRVLPVLVKIKNGFEKLWNMLVGVYQKIVSRFKKKK